MTTPPTLPPAPSLPGPQPQDAQPPAPAATPVPAAAPRVAPVDASAASGAPGTPGRTRGGSSKAASIALLIGGVALVLGASALALTLLRSPGAVAGCDPKTLWTTYPAAGRLPSGWAYDSLGPYTSGLTGSISQATGESFSPTIYFNTSCSSDAAAMLDAWRETTAIADGASEIGFEKVGDESVATKSDDDAISAAIRIGSTIIQINSYSADVELDTIQDLAKAFEEAFTGPAS